MKLSVLFLFVFTLACSSSKPPELNGPMSLVGTWEGDMQQGNGLPFHTKLVITEENGIFSGIIFHDSLNCAGKLQYYGVQNNTYEFYQTITDGMNNCFDGRNEISLIDGNTIKRTWFQNRGHVTSTGTMKRKHEN